MGIPIDQEIEAIIKGTFAIIKYRDGGRIKIANQEKMAAK
jgi:hypothetical protein